jgi:hypothetical protein
LSDALHLDVHGIRVEVRADDPDLLAAVTSDFSLLAVHQASARPALRIDLAAGSPPDGALPAGAGRVFRTKDAHVLRAGAVQAYVSPGRALVVHDFREERGRLFGPDRDLLLEKTYLLLMSRLGALLDRRGLHRVHAMGVVVDGRAVLCLLPMGGGKTTLALSLMEASDVTLLSEEVPLVGRDGRLHAFPIRLGLAGPPPAGIPVEFVRPFRRSRHGPKTLVDARVFAGRIADPANPGLLLVGRRGAGREPRIRPLGQAAAMRALLPSCLLGRQLPELREYAVPLLARPAFAAAAALAARARACRALAARSRAFSFELGTDRAANAALVLELAGRDGAAVSAEETA